jgi:hypothetical protein
MFTGSHFWLELNTGTVIKQEFIGKMPCNNLYVFNIQVSMLNLIHEYRFELP